MERTIVSIFFILFCFNSNYAQSIYDARIREKEILTPLPNKEPKINGAKIYGGRPGKEFIYRIPCQGIRPIKFEINELPPSLAFDEKQGIIRGTLPKEQGEYSMTFHATNNHGKNMREFKLVIGDAIALTPPTGWNSWGGHMLLVTDETIRKTTDLFVHKGFADAGYQYISIDDCWMKIDQESYDARSEKKKKKHEGFSYEGLIGDVRDTAGNIEPNENFPNMKALTDYIHSFGLKAGLYSSPGPYTCQNFAGSMGYEKKDAEQYAAWGFDLLKYDLCSGRLCLEKMQDISKTYPRSALWEPMIAYVKQQDRDILFNLCQYGEDEPWTWAPELGAATWRTAGDLNHHVEKYFKYALQIATELREYSEPGQWNDPDFMYIHKLRDHTKMVAPSKEISLNTNQRYQYVTLWSVICAPFFFSSDINEIDEFTIRLLTNEEVLNINQDELGHVAEVIKNEDNEVMMLKKMGDGSKVLAVFNRDTENEKTVRVDFDKIGMNKKVDAFDVWRKKDLGTFKQQMSIQLSPNGVALFVLK